MMQHKYCIVIGMALALGSCSLHTPALPLFSKKESWNESKTPVLPQATIDHAWWKQFHDPMLEKLIEQAKAQSPDIKIAKARIAQARAKEQGTWSDQLPNVSGFAGASRIIPSKNLTNRTTKSSPYNLFDSNFDASWELDIFGVGSALRASKAYRKTVEADYDQVLVSLWGDIARHYFEIRQYQARLAVHKKTIAAQKGQLELADALYNAGQTSNEGSVQAKALLAATEAEAAPLEQGLKESYYQLQSLLGNSTISLDEILQEPTHTEPPSIEPTLASPSVIITQRPDIKRAAEQLSYTTALHDAAISQYFPHLSLSAVLGVESSLSGHLFTSNSRTSTLSGGVSLPILDFGRIHAQVKETDAAGQEALASYEKTVLAAFSEVESALSAYNNEQRHYQDLTVSVDASTRSLDIANMRYKEGLSSYLNVLDAQKTLYDAQVKQSDSIFNSYIQLIRLYKALGGGWKMEEQTTELP